MAWVAVGTTAVAVGSQLYAADEQKKAMNDAANKQSAAAASELEFAKEQQAKWDEVFGPTQQNLAEYYNTLDPNDVAAQKVQSIQQGYQSYQENLDKQLAQRGLSQSGLSAETMGQGMYQAEQAKAQARLDAPREVAAAQAGFLGLGMGQQGATQSLMGQAYGNQQALASGQYNAAAGQYGSAVQGIGSAVGAGAQLYGYYKGQQTMQPATNAMGYQLPSLPVQTGGYTPLKS